ARQAARQRFLLDARMQACAGLERRIRLALRHQFDSLEKAAPAYVADMRMVAEPFIEQAVQVFAQLCRTACQAVPFDDVLDGQGGCAGDGMPDISVAVLESARARDDRIHDL